jgi:Cu2+-exporting ATPase
MADVRCTHCGLPVPKGLVNPDSELQFCCGGCKMVYETIHGCGLQKFYDIRDDEEMNVAAPSTGKGCETFDEPSFTEQYVSARPDGALEIELYLQGVHCAACVWLVERLPQVLDGVIESRLDFRRSVTKVVWNPAKVKLSRIGRLLDSLGYPPSPYRSGGLEDIRRGESRRHLIRIGIAGICAMNVMVIAFALYGGMFASMEKQYETLFRWASLGLTIIALAWPGRVFFVGALSSLRTRMMHMDLPVAIALTTGTAWGAVNVIRGTGDIYFESLTAVIFLLLVGRFIQHKQQRAANDAIELMYSLTPQTTRVIDEDGSVREAAVESLTEGMHVEVRAGDSIPADGVIFEGASTFDLALLTGESRPVELGAGDEVHAGTVNLSERIVLDVRATGMHTRVGRLMALVEQFARERPPIVMLADRVAHWFVIIVLALAAGTVGVWLALEPSNPGAAVEHAIALLIVTCPCALGLATPLAVIVGIGRAAGRGILIKGGDIVERLAGAGDILLDKTGTLTEGRMKMVRWSGDDAVKPLVSAMEKQVAHPIARAFVEALEDDVDRSASIDAGDVQAQQTLGGGVAGRVGDRAVRIGSIRFVEEHVDVVPEWARDEAQACLDDGLSPVMVAVDDEVAAVAGFGDPLVEDAHASIDELRTMGWRPSIVSGDHEVIVKATARTLGLDEEGCAGGMAPEAKVDAARRRQADGSTVIMIGDGVNDAAALSAADVGVAVHGGAEASLAAADVFLTRPGLDAVVELIEGSRRTVRVIKRNLAVSLMYNVVTATLAVTGVINPLIAAVLMPISSLSVVTMSYRSRTFGR